jgi:hypothetical protein
VKGVCFVAVLPDASPLTACPQAIEVRVGQQGVKAKWVRIELRKVETLPGGTPNTFTDYVGPSPVNLWQASEEYAILHTVGASLKFCVPASDPSSGRTARLSVLHSYPGVHSTQHCSGEPR